MKKILFSLVALVCSMSMNAQVMKVMKNGEEVATYQGAEYSVVFEEELKSTPTSTSTGTSKRYSNIDVAWVQLWDNGPKFAEYNVGATSVNEYGGYYCWGSSLDKDSDAAYKSGTDALTGTDDTATNLWGSNWRMPTQAELQALLENCDVEWITVNDMNGCKFTGKNNYASNSVFFPAAGDYVNGKVSGIPGRLGFYWSSSPCGNDSFCLSIFSHTQNVYNDGPRNYSYSVRAVLAE